MSLNFVSLICDLYDGQGSPVITGKLIFTPSTALIDATDHIRITRAPVTVSLLGNPLPVIQLAATDNSALSPPDWSWLVSAFFPAAPPPRQFLLPFSGGTPQYLSEVGS